MNHLIVGNGQVGSAIAELLKADAIDIGEEPNLDAYTHIHICFPYSDSFKDSVKKYTSKKVLIHSTVPIGTSKELGVTYSPIRGTHPNLYQGIKTFRKYFAGPHGKEFAEIFNRLGIDAYFDQDKDSDSLEAAKIWDTTQYGVMIALEKYMHDWCKDKSLDFNLIYKAWNETYNDGYSKLGKPEYSRPVLKHMDGPIGGHCVLPNLSFLDVPEVVSFIRRYVD